MINESGKLFLISITLLIFSSLRVNSIVEAYAAKVVGLSDDSYGKFTIWKKGWKGPDRKTIESMLNSTYSRKELEKKYR